MRGRLFKKFASCLALCTAAFTASSAYGVGDVVISQVWGGATFLSTAPNADYVELFNRSAAPVNLSGWSVSVASSTGTAWWLVSATMPPRASWPPRARSARTAASTSGRRRRPRWRPIEPVRPREPRSRSTGRSPQNWMPILRPRSHTRRLDFFAPPCRKTKRFGMGAVPWT